MPVEYQLVIIGGGTAAIAAITEALAIGIDNIAYIEKRPEIGGECALNACLPLHTLSYAAKLYHDACNLSSFGVEASPAHLNINGLTRLITQRVQANPTDPFINSEQVTRLYGHASFLTPHVLCICTEDHQFEIRGRTFLIATGASPIIPSIPGLAEVGYWVYKNAVHMQQLPRSLVIVGGGRIGIEFAQTFQRLGSQVTLLECQSCLLHREDRDVSLTIHELLKKEGITVYLNCQILKVEMNNQEKCLQVQISKQDDFMIRAEEILVATGRKGNTEGLGLAKTGVTIDENGIIVNSQCQTSTENIWAAGDVVGPYRFTHVADYQAVVAVTNSLGKRQKRLEYKALPLVYFTDPSFARIGLTEEQAKVLYQTVIILKEHVEKISRYQIEEQYFGFCKIIIDMNTDLILGAHIIASQAGEIIHIIALAIQMNITVPQLTQMVYAYPTKSQLIQKTLEQYRSLKQNMQATDFL